MSRSIFKVTKKEDIILPSGVKATIKGLEGKHQEMITNQDDKKRLEGFKTMLWDCIVSIGNVSNISENYIDKITSFDRKFILWRIRKLSNDDNPKFVFDYEFPAKNGTKHKERFEIDFDEKSFPTIPSIWVRKKMYDDYASEKNITGELSYDEKSEAILGDFPVMYDSYDEMLNEHYQKTITLPECQVEIFWHLSTGEDEDKLSKIPNYKNSSHTQFHMRTPKFINKELSEIKKKEIIERVPINDLCNQDVEFLRRNIMETEGNVDSLVVVQSKKDTSLMTQIDLLQTPAFFFASLAV